MHNNTTHKRRLWSLQVRWGGIRKENRELMQRWGRLVYLRAEPGTLLARIGPVGGVGRPLLHIDKPGEELRALLVERAPLYEETEWIVDTDDLTPEEVVAQMINILAD